MVDKPFSKSTLANYISGYLHASFHLYSFVFYIHVIKSVKRPPHVSNQVIYRHGYEKKVITQTWPPIRMPNRSLL